MKTGKQLAILFFTLVIVMMGFGMILPILPYYVESFGANGVVLGLLISLFSIGQLIFAPIWGSLSDRVGRKPILLLGAFGNAVSMFLLGFASQIWMLLLFRALSGILSSATLPTAMAYIGDSTSEDKRGSGMGMIGAAMGMGMVLGPGIGGWLAKPHTDDILKWLPFHSDALSNLSNNQTLSTPFYFASVLSLFAVLFITVLLPESLPRQDRNNSREVKSLQVQELSKALTGPLGFLFFLSFLVSFGITNFESVFGLFAFHRFNYGPDKVGAVLSVNGLLSAFIQGLLTGPLTRKWGEQTLIKLSLLGSVFGFIIMLLARNDLTLFITVAIFIIGNTLLRPSLSTLISKKTDSGQGRSMGLANSYMSIGRIIGPLWAGFLFDVHSSLPYISGALVMLAGFLFSIHVFKQNTAREKRSPAV